MLDILLSMLFGTSLVCADKAERALLFSLAFVDHIKLDVFVDNFGQILGSQEF